MSRFVINKPGDMEAAVKAIVKQSFPAAQSSTLATEILDKETRSGGIEFTTQAQGSNRERFVWGISRMGCSRLVG